MTANDLVPEDSQPATRLFGGLAGDLDGEPDHRPPLVLLHGRRSTAPCGARLWAR